MSKSSTASKPSKPYPEFPLFPHATRRWAKKIKGKLHYFGPWRDPDGALQRYLDQRDDLHAGRAPRQKGGSVTVADMANHFLAAKDAMVASGDLAAGSFLVYRRTARRMAACFGRHREVSDLRPSDFARLRADMATNLAPTTLTSEMSNVSSFFRLAVADQLIPHAVCFGSSWRSPSAKVLLQARYAKGSMMFEPKEIHRMLAAADDHLAAMLLFGVNCGFGPTDLTTLPESAVDLKTGWVVHPRPKTGVYRRAPLWPETVVALRKSLAHTPRLCDKTLPASFFLSRSGRPYKSGVHCSMLKDGFRVFLRRLDLYRPKLGFYGLRRAFETIGGESIDQVAVDFIMGHSKGDMGSVYRQRISDERLVAVVEHVRGWLFSTDENE